jgi:hypothetical protein
VVSWYTLVTGATEEYDGTNWTTSPKFKYSKKFLAGAGTQTAALAFGGYNDLLLLQEQQKNIMEIVGQHSNPLNTARRFLAGCGTQTAALAFGGYGTPANTGATEEYDGTSWTSS